MNISDSNINTNFFRLEYFIIGLIDLARVCYFAALTKRVICTVGQGGYRHGSQIHFSSYVKLQGDF